MRSVIKREAWPAATGAPTVSQAQLLRALESKYNHYGVTLTQLDVLGPAVGVSPRIPPGTIDHRACDHSCTPKTLEEAFGLQPLTKRPKVADSLKAQLTLPAARRNASAPLPAPVPAGRLALAAAPTGTDSVVSGSLPLFLHIAIRHELAFSRPGKRLAVLERARSVKTRAQAAEYLRGIGDTVGGARASGSGGAPSKSP